MSSSDLVLPGELPRGETVLWQGRPSWRAFALRAFHVRGIAVYFGLILAWRALGPYERGEAGLVGDLAPLLLLGLAAVGIAVLLAVLYARTTVYTITNRRVFMRYGAALPKMLNLPFRRIAGAAARLHRDGTADIPLSLLGPDRLAFLHLWPNVRPWRLARAEPMLRGVPDGARVAALLGDALADAQAQGAASREQAAAEATRHDLASAAA